MTWELVWMLVVLALLALLVGVGVIFLRVLWQSAPHSRPTVFYKVPKPVKAKECDLWVNEKDHVHYWDNKQKEWIRVNGY